MKTKLITTLAWLFITLSGLSVLYVSVLAMINPQQVMQLVQVTLPNNDAYSSIRGVYGGVGITLVTVLFVAARKNVQYALSYLALFWGMYSISRIITMVAEGPLGNFGQQWLVIETGFSLLALVLLFLHKKTQSKQSLIKHISAA